MDGASDDFGIEFTSSVCKEDFAQQQNSGAKRRKDWPFTAELTLWGGSSGFANRLGRDLDGQVGPWKG
jgi:hypothetical protein